MHYELDIRTANLTICSISLYKLCKIKQIISDGCGSSSIKPNIRKSVFVEFSDYKDLEDP